MTQPHQTHHPMAALKLPEIRYFLGSISCFTLANRAMVVIIGFQIYQMTKSALALGILGLVEAIPAISLSLFGGYAADRFNRRSILLITRAVSVICGLLLAYFSAHPDVYHISALYAVIFLAGIARGFSDPATSSFEALVVPKHLTVNAASWISSVFLSCSILGPAMVGFIYDAVGTVKTYLLLSVLFGISWICTAFIPSKKQPPIEQHESIFKSIASGLKFVLREQALIGSMCLDLFAVLFSGAIALLPIFATDILNVGAKGLGILSAAPAVGALSVMLWSTHKPPLRHAGRNLLLCVAGFGVSVIVFGLSKNFLLSIVALVFVGIFDGVSMVIRRSIVRLLSPDHMRGRVSSVGWIFIGASNELGAFQSGMMAHWIGAVPCVFVGGLITLGVVTFTALKSPQLRNLRFDLKSMNRITNLKD